MKTSPSSPHVSPPPNDIDCDRMAASLARSTSARAPDVGLLAKRRESTEVERLSNDGERLVPRAPFGVAELVRHRSSYLFFKSVIEADMAREPKGSTVSVVDLACGVGHGCATIAELPRTRVLGVDRSAAAIAYARQTYGRPNVEYDVADLWEYVTRIPVFEYVVSRGSLEHVPRGIELAASIRPRRRLMFDVPYAEPRGANPHHCIHDIREDAFVGFRNVEIFYEDLWGVVYDETRRPRRPNLIMCISSSDGVPPVRESLSFPVRAWRPETRLDRLRLLHERGVALGGRVKRAVTRA
jgi:SAM-dependent methyltransferase